MEKLPVHRILEFHPNTYEFVRKEYNLDKPGQMDAAIDILDDWVKKQAHFTKKDFRREYLERTIILDKGSIERAKSQLDKLFTMKTSTPHYFEKLDVRDADYTILHNYYVDALLPKLTKEHYRIYAGKILKDGITTKLFTHSFQFGALIFEHIRSNDYCAGFIGIIDYRNINILELFAQINISEMHRFLLFITEGYQMRVKGIHLLTSSKAIEVIVRFFKQVFSKKIGDRIQAHTTIETLYEYVPKELLPEDFGGELKSLVEQNKDWVNEFSTEENIKSFKEMNQAKINEHLRNGPKTYDDHLSIPGSFRTLSVD